MRFFGILAFSAYASVLAAPIVPLVTGDEGSSELSVDTAIVAGMVTPEICMSNGFVDSDWANYFRQPRSPNARQ